MAHNPPHGQMLREVLHVEGFDSSEVGLPRRLGYWYLLLCENRHGGRHTLAGTEEGFQRYVKPLRRDDRWDVELGPEVMLGFDFHAPGWITEWTDTGDWCWHWYFHR